MNSVKLSQLYSELVMGELSHYWQKRSRSVADCGNYLTFSIRSDGTKKLAGANFCQKRLCPMCGWRKSLKNAGQLFKVATAAIEENPKMTFLFLTLTVKNVPGDQLRETLKTMSNGFKALTKNVNFAKSVKGYYRSVEITQTNDDGTWHPHIHVMLAVNSTYFKSGYYISQAKWADMWQQAMRLDYTPIVHIERVYQNKKREGQTTIQSAVSEAAKYATKSADWLSGSTDQQTLKVKTLTEALDGLRLTAYGGIFKDLHKRLNLTDIESDSDLVHVSEVDDESTDETVELCIKVYKWFGNNYFG